LLYITLEKLFIPSELCCCLPKLQALMQVNADKEKNTQKFRFAYKKTSQQLPPQQHDRRWGHRLVLQRTTGTTPWYGKNFSYFGASWGTSL